MIPRSCEVQPCSFNGVYQPSLLETFPHGKILLLHFFDDRLSPFLTTTADPLKAPIHVSAFADLAKIVCQGPTAWKEHWGSDAGLMQELEQARLTEAEPNVVPCYWWVMHGADPVRLPPIPVENLPVLPCTGLSQKQRDEETKVVKIASLDRPRPRELCTYCLLA